ncbi:hypothetical protein PR048_007611 [Dryococelus australis]|uniref:Copia protein n=1 Tax=Dryococelus australis TaxID=614101 RepID=A0ABQ9HUS0_9NEOP|nr:hypothetical protein PR048_007611 [Dryococelus australis]
MIELYKARLVERVLLKGKVWTLNKLLYRSDVPPHLSCFSDSDFANDQKTHKSRTGVVISFCREAITWLSRKQTTTALSTTEAEYIAAIESTKEILWVNCLVKEILNFKLTQTLSVNNRSVIHLITNPEFHCRTKHVEVEVTLHHVNEKYIDREFILEHVPTGQQLADIFTKGLPHGSFMKNRDCLGALGLGGSVGANKRN